LPREIGELLVYYLWLILPLLETIQFQLTKKVHSSPFCREIARRRSINAGPAPRLGLSRKKNKKKMR